MTDSHFTGDASKSPDVLDIVLRGAGVRRHRLFSQVRSMWPSVALAIGGNWIAYLGFMLVSNRSDWQNIVIVCLVLAAVPALTGAFLVSVRRNQFPITVAVIVCAVVFNFSIAPLSAARVPISYSALALAGLWSVLLMSHANVKFHRLRRSSVGLLQFPGSAQVLEILGGGVALVQIDAAEVTEYERILIDTEAHHSASWAQFMTRLYMLGIEVMPWFQYVEARYGRVYIQTFDITHVAYSVSQIYYSKAKRVIDIIACLLVIPFAALVCCTIWLFIRWVDGGPSIFVQERRGYGGRTFRMYKFRTMYRDTEGGATQRNDARILPGCDFLRKIRLDELPQLVNILKGDMSWIGPRPVSVEIARTLEAKNIQYINRQLVLPGLTGWAQVSHGYASSNDEEIEKLSYDLYYIKNISFDLDLLILAKTVRTILFGVGAK
jgi:lipopolysaccharide/colanic/teichoic acid biosynthesis glycosyltransferase